ncbi:2'-5' RNA ligase [Pseudomonas alcaligenes]|uniref:RNA 2',3'-cyclic phosphodiesterase n=1 Tax=Aquipseudomonas alcaligenes TaxID=43263 RepID=A0ABR7RZ46_AQUAC|nr:RNA 2',3'-cyclic phosphodiesterase [Pseudomonas alcaligenes]MBC9250602.1 2'-5' RNA ligase [Pseudomonas alcaligenes]
MAQTTDDQHGRALRLFFALPCPPPIARQIAAWRQALAADGKLVAPANLHLTLAFLGSLDAHHLTPLGEIAASIQLPAFDLQLDRLACWSQGLLHLAPSQPPQPLLELVEQLQSRLRQHGYQQPGHAFRPHLTLARHSHLPAISPLANFAWTVERFALYASADGHYRELHSWPLENL